MWKDRFSGHSTPSASPVPWNRSGSPAPQRRPSHLAPNGPPRRPGLPQRVTSWSGLTNGSTDFLPPNARAPNASGLREQLSSTVVSGNHDPLHALHEILGLKQEKISAATLKESDFVEDVEFGGLSLQAFVESSTAERNAADPAKEIPFAQCMCLTRNSRIQVLIKNGSRIRKAQVRGFAQINCRM